MAGPVMSKLANPWKCDASNCGILRANDTNHWLVIFATKELIRCIGPLAICIEPWSEERAEIEGTKHACGIDCGLKVVAQLIVEHFFPNEISSTPQQAGGQAGKDVSGDT
jgi:hypothetical protein